MSPQLTLLAAAAVVALGGCAATASPEYDKRFGDSVRQVRAQQLVDPNAPNRNAQTTPRTDGRTVREASDRYHDSYRQPPPSTIVNIGVGGGGGGGGGGR